jgi:subtilisin family serine protease
MSQTVLIYATQRERTRLTRQGFQFLAEYQDYVLTQASDEQVEELRLRGYEVEIYRRQADQGIALDASEPKNDPGPSSFGPGEHYYLIDFVGPIKPEWLAEIGQQGGELQEPEPPNGYIVALDDPAYEFVVAAPYVAEVRHYGVERRISPDLMAGLGDSPLISRGLALDDSARAARALPSVERVPNAFTVRFFQPDDLAAALGPIRELGGTPSEPSPGARVITVSFDPQAEDLTRRVEQLAALHGVRAVEPYVLRQLRNDVCGGLMAAPEVQAVTGLNLSGRGEIVGMADSGLDTGVPNTLHPDFSGRVSRLLSWPVAQEWSSMVTNVGADDGPADTRSGHGTHVAGSILGNGAAWSNLGMPGAPVRGLAHEATLVFQAIEQSLKWTESYRQAYFRRYGRFPADHGLAGLPTDLRLLFQQAYDAGARIHSNSWGGGPFGAYDDYAEAVDRFMWEHKDFLILIAAGNDGSDDDRDGVADQGSVTPPGTAKNCVTVGAAESVRTQGGYQRTWGSLWPDSYPMAPLKADLPSDNGDDIAAFSSRGPTRDGRIKPDVVAPGTNILSTRSSVLASGGLPGWGAWSASNRYMFNGGTSMSTPLVAGAAALVRQYFRTRKRRSNPSAALVKAALLHGAGYRRYRHEPAGPGLYDWSQGWGHVDLCQSLTPPPPADVRWYDLRRGLNTGESWRWTCTVNDLSVPLGFTLAWTDYPGSPSVYPNLVNDLDLVITSPSGATYYGNSRDGQPGGAPDRVNNVERLVIAQPEPGRYAIRVRAFNVPRGPQDFALVYSGGLL